MTEYFLIVKHPNGGYAAVSVSEDGVVPEATKRSKKFAYPDDAYLWAQGHASRLGVRYSDEARAEVQTSFARATRRDR